MVPEVGETHKSSDSIDLTNEYRRSKGVRIFRALIAVFLVASFATVLPGFVGVASAQSTDSIVDAIEQDGSYVEGDRTPELDRAIQTANDNGIAYVQLDRDAAEGEVLELADDLLAQLFERQAGYGTVLVLAQNDYAATNDGIQSRLDAALNAAFEGFSTERPATGLSDFTESLYGVTADNSSPQSTQQTDTSLAAADEQTAEQTDGTTSPAPDPTESSGGGIGLGSILLFGALVFGGFWLFRRWRNGKAAQEKQDAETEIDRQEIKEQLRSNADRVIDLGDQVITNGDPELIARYEEASQTYQDVSSRIDAATTGDEVDALDDRIDHAEWQFETIEARLQNRPEPESPAEIEARAEAARKRLPPPSPAKDEGVVRSPTSGREYRRRSPRRRRGGGFGGILGNVIGSILIGGMSGGFGMPSRRSQRRRGGGGGFGDIFGQQQQQPRSRGGGSFGGGIGDVFGRSNGGPRSSGSRSRSSRRSRGNRRL